MKGVFAVLLAATAAAAWADEATIGSVGVLNVTSSQKSTIIATSFENLEGGNSNEIVVSNLVKTANLTAGDHLYVYSGGTYDGWTLTAGTGGAKYWQKNANTFTVGAGGALSEGSGADAATTTKLVGDGIFLVRDGDGYTEGTEFTITLYGCPPTGTLSTTVARDSSNNTAALVGNPSSSAASPTITGMASGDAVVTVGANGTQLRTTYNGSKWNHIDTTTHLPAEGLPSIPAGTGFWYVAAKGSGNVTVTW